MMDLVIPAMLGGLATGAIYALVALGLTLIYGVLHIINFAHGKAAQHRRNDEAHHGVSWPAETARVAGA